MATSAHILLYNTLHYTVIMRLQSENLSLDFRINGHSCYKSQDTECSIIRGFTGRVNYTIIDGSNGYTLNNGYFDVSERSYYIVIIYLNQFSTVTTNHYALDEWTPETEARSLRALQKSNVWNKISKTLELGH